MIDSRLDRFLKNGHQSDRDVVADQCQEHDQIDTDHRSEERGERRHDEEQQGDRERAAAPSR